MPEKRFDPGGYLTFDLTRGAATLPGDAPAVVLPAEVLERIADDRDGGCPGTIAHPLGEWIGTRVREALAAAGGKAEDVSPEAFLAETNGMLAVHGLGRVALETYGDALLLRPDVAAFPKAGAAFLEPFFAGLLGAFLARDVPCLALDGAGGPCLLVASPAAVRRAAQLRSAGIPPETIATRLHQESRAAREGK